MEKTLIDISKIENPLERLNHYLARGFTKEALKDKDCDIRWEAKRTLEIQAKYRSK